MSNKILIKEYHSPTDIFILGDAAYGSIPADFALTDDECSLGIKRGKHSVNITTFGFGYIFTTEEVIENVCDIDYETISDGVYIDQFEGKIYAVIESVSGNAKFKEDVDLQEYLYYQGEHEDNDDIEISLLIEDKNDWQSHFFYRPFPVDMIVKLLQCAKKTS